MVESTKIMVDTIGKVTFKINQKKNIKKKKSYYSALLHKILHEYILIHHSEISTDKQLELEQILYEKIIKSLETPVDQLPTIFSLMQFHIETNHKKNKVGKKIYSLLSISNTSIGGLIASLSFSGVQGYNNQNKEETGIFKIMLLTGICSAVLSGITFFTKNFFLKKYFSHYQQCELEIIACNILINNALEEIEKTALIKEN